jgi:hypothetical protein
MHFCYGVVKNKTWVIHNLNSVFIQLKLVVSDISIHIEV